MNVHDGLGTKGKRENSYRGTYSYVLTKTFHPEELSVQLALDWFRQTRGANTEIWCDSCKGMQSYWPCSCYGNIMRLNLTFSSSTLFLSKASWNEERVSKLWACLLGKTYAAVDLMWSGGIHAHRNAMQTSSINLLSGHFLWLSMATKDNHNHHY